MVYFDQADPLHKVSIIPRGQSLGGTMHFPEGEKVHWTKKHYRDELAVLAAGRCAGELIYDEVDSGAAMDIRMCSRIARAMVTRFGMSEKTGFVEYASTDEEMGYLGHLSRP